MSLVYNTPLDIIGEYGNVNNRRDLDSMVSSIMLIKQKVENSWESIPEEEKRMLIEWAESSLGDEHRGIKWYFVSLVKHIITFVKNLIMMSYPIVSNKRIYNAMLELRRAVLDAIERENPEYQKMISDVIEDLDDVYGAGELDIERLRKIGLEAILSD